MEMSRRRKTALIVLTAGVAALVLLVFYGPGWFIAWADDPGT
jgi:predicted branched-subunit amino acid permease